MNASKYIFIPLLSAVAGSLITVGLLAVLLQRFMPQMMSQMMPKMMAQMSEGGCSPER